MIETRHENEVAPQELIWSGMTHRGRVRPNNEDAFLALTFDMHDVRYLGKIGQSTFQGGDYVFAVSDGMGGAKSGEFASRIAVDKITTVRRARIGPSLGRLSSADLQRLNGAIAVFLGVAG